MKSSLLGLWEFVKLFLSEAGNFAVWISVGAFIGLTLGLLLAYPIWRFGFPKKTFLRLKLETVGLWKQRWLATARHSWWATWWLVVPGLFMITGMIGGSAKAVQGALRHHQLVTKIGDSAVLPLVHSAWKTWGPVESRNVGIDTPLDITAVNGNIGHLLEASPESLCQIKAKDGSISPTQAWWMSQAIHIFMIAAMQNEHDAFMGQRVLGELRTLSKPLPSDPARQSVTLREASLVLCKCVVDPLVAGWASSLIWSQTVPFLAGVLALWILPPAIFWGCIWYSRRRAEKALRLANTIA